MARKMTVNIPCTPYVKEVLTLRGRRGETFDAILRRLLGLAPDADVVEDGDEKR